MQTFISAKFVNSKIILHTNIICDKNRVCIIDYFVLKFILIPIRTEKKQKIYKKRKVISIIP